MCGLRTHLWTGRLLIQGLGHRNVHVGVKGVQSHPDHLFLFMTALMTESNQQLDNYNDPVVHLHPALGQTRTRSWRARSRDTWRTRS